MINLKDLKLFGIVFLINAVMLIIELLVVQKTGFSWIVFFLFVIVETFLLDKLAIKGGIID